MAIPSRSDRLLARWIAWRWLLLALALALALIAVVPAARVDFDRSIENMFARDSELLRPYRRLKRVFGGNEIVLLVYADDQLMSADGAGIRRLAELSGRLRGIDGVSAVLSLAELNRVLAGMGTSIVAANDPLAASYREMFAGYTHSLDGRTAALVCMLDAEGLTGARRQAAVSAIREVALTRTASGQPGMIAGEPVMVVEGFRYVERDAQRLGWITLLLLGGVIAVCFRSAGGVRISLEHGQLDAHSHHHGRRRGGRCARGGTLPR